MLYWEVYLNRKIGGFGVLNTSFLLGLDSKRDRKNCISIEDSVSDKVNWEDSVGRKDNLRANFLKSIKNRVCQHIEDSVSACWSDSLSHQRSTSHCVSASLVISPSAPLACSTIGSSWNESQKCRANSLNYYKISLKSSISWEDSLSRSGKDGIGYRDWPYRIGLEDRIRW